MNDKNLYLLFEKKSEIGVSKASGIWKEKA